MRGQLDHEEQAIFGMLPGGSLRGVARVYEMSFTAGVWKLSRTSPDLSPLNFSQRFTGTFSPAGDVIEGRWEIATDGSNWEHDFDLTCTKVS